MNPTAHRHGPHCGHIGIDHRGHTDYLQDGRLHYAQGERIEEHALEVGTTNPATCTPQHSCDGHEKGHVHGPNCGHEQVPHGDHIDHPVKGHLHHPHGNHCDDHGPVSVV